MTPSILPVVDVVTAAGTTRQPATGGVHVARSVISGHVIAPR